MNFMKKLISFITIFTIISASLVFADDYGASRTSGGLARIEDPSAQEFLRPGANGPIFTEGKETEAKSSSQIIEATKEANVVDEQKQAQLSALRAQLAKLRGETLETTTIPNINITVNNISSGYTVNGVGYGFARLAQNIAARRGDTTFISATHLGENHYEVVLSSVDTWANGTFLIDVYDDSSAELKEGYQVWIGLYDANLKRIGTAQAKKKK